MVYNVELRFAAKTDTGLLRPHNEDSIVTSAAHGFAVLADGMGGYNAGEVASGIATAFIKEILEERLHAVDWQAKHHSGRQIQQLMAECVDRVNAIILEAARTEPMYTGMGTTLVMALFHHDRATVAHVGDSRLYRLRQDELTLVTHDHSLLQQQIDAGLIDPEQARFSPHRNLITRAVGVDHAVEAEIHEHLTEPGDIYLLCSDGLSDMLSTQEIKGILNRLDGDIDAASKALIKRANDNGGRDNTSVILVKIESSDAETTGLVERIWNWLKRLKH